MMFFYLDIFICLLALHCCHVANDPPLPRLLASVTAYLSVCRFIRLLIYLSVCLSVRLNVCLFTCLSVSFYSPCIMKMSSPLESLILYQNVLPVSLSVSCFIFSVCLSACPGVSSISPLLFTTCFRFLTHMPYCPVPVIIYWNVEQKI